MNADELKKLIEVSVRHYEKSWGGDNVYCRVGVEERESLQEITAIPVLETSVWIQFRGQQYPKTPILMQRFFGSSSAFEKDKEKVRVLLYMRLLQDLIVGGFAASYRQIATMVRDGSMSPHLNKNDYPLTKEEIQ